MFLHSTRQITISIDNDKKIVSTKQLFFFRISLVHGKLRINPVIEGKNWLAINYDFSIDINRIPEESF